MAAVCCQCAFLTFTFSHAGLATHYIPSHRIPDVLKSLSSSTELTLQPAQINSLLNKFSGELQPYSLLPLQEAIDYVFMAPNIETILKRANELSQSPKSEIADWAKSTIATLKQLSPTALHTTLMLLQKGAVSTIKSALRNEFTLAQNYVEKVVDLYSGINAKLIHKTGDPKWQPSSLSDVDHEFIKSLFAKPKDPITRKNYCRGKCAANLACSEILQ